MASPGARTIATSKLTSKAQTVVPREIRERLGLRPGDTVRYRATKSGIVIDRRPEICLLVYPCAISFNTCCSRSVSLTVIKIPSLVQ